MGSRWQSPEWTLIRCPLPTPRRRADGFLIRLLGPLMNGLVEVREVDRWHFERFTASAAGVHALVRDPALLVARLTGLVSAVGSLASALHRGGCAGTGPPPWPDVDLLDAASRAHTDLSCRSAQLALEVIAATPTGPSRMRAAADLAIATTIALDLGRVATHDWLAARADASADDEDHPVGRNPHRHLLPATVGGRWQRVHDGVAAGRGPVARWAADLRAGRPADRAAGTDRARALHHLHNQLGLSPGEECEVHTMLARSLLLPAGGRAGDAQPSRFARPARCVHPPRS